MAEIEIHDPLLLTLFEDGLLPEEQVIEIYEEYQQSGQPIRELILGRELISEEQLLTAIGNQMGAEVIDLENHPVPDSVLAQLPASIAQMYNVVPVEADSYSIVLATFDLLSPNLVDELGFVLTRDVRFVVATEDAVSGLLKSHYAGGQSVSDMIYALEEELEEAGDVLELQQGDNAVEDLEEAASSAPVVKFVNLILFQAVQDHASDIHFEPFENDFKIRYRVDGALYEMSPPPAHLSLPVISRVKVISGLNIAERRLPQDGRIQMKVGGRTIDFRVSTLPTQFGESVVLRVLDRGVISLDMDNIGLPQDVHDMFADDIRKPNGIVVVTGPTGSGKTTTLYSALGAINTIDTKLLTAEDPVEYDIDGIIQVPVNEAIGVTFSRVLRAFLRQDPDVILVGEIRDLKTAETAIQASLTGHLVFSTLHTNDAAGAITRLIDMDVEPFLIASTVEAVLGQRLLRTICDKCREPYSPDDDQLDILGLRREDIGDRPFYYGKGCAACNDTGYRGRRGIFEYMRISDPIRELIIDRKPTVVLRDKAVEMGMRTLREDGIRCILDGSTTLEEVLKYT